MQPNTDKNSSCGYQALTQGCSSFSTAPLSSMKSKTYFSVICTIDSCVVILLKFSVDIGAFFPQYEDNNIIRK